MELLLTDAEARVLGCLIEKELTTPDAYPLTLNALRNACCQKSNRDPVVQMEERDVLRAIDGLIDKKLASIFHSAGGRVPKYKHRMEGTLFLDEATNAILAELMLRGPQTAGELRSRASRMHAFDSIQQVEAVLAPLLEEPEAMVTKLAVQPGRKEPRFAQLLCGAVEIEDLPPPKTEKLRMEMHAEDERLEKLETDVQALRRELEELRASFQAFKGQFE